MLLKIELAVASAIVASLAVPALWAVPAIVAGLLPVLAVLADRVPVRRILAGLAVLAVATIGTVGTVAVTPHAATAARPMAACANEDGSGSTIPCVWRAARQGNGRGHDVVYLRTANRQQVHAFSAYGACERLEERPSVTACIPA